MSGFLIALVAGCILFLLRRVLFARKRSPQPQPYGGEHATSHASRHVDQPRAYGSTSSLIAGIVRIMIALGLALLVLGLPIIPQDINSNIDRVVSGCYYGLDDRCSICDLKTQIILRLSTAKQFTHPTATVSASQPDCATRSSRGRHSSIFMRIRRPVPQG